MTIKELTETINNYDDIEVYYPLSTGRHYPNYFHTDNCKLVDNYNELSQVGFYELMGEMNIIIRCSLIQILARILPTGMEAVTLRFYALC